MVHRFRENMQPVADAASRERAAANERLRPEPERQTDRDDNDADTPRGFYAGRVAHGVVSDAGTCAGFSTGRPSIASSCARVSSITGSSAPRVRTGFTGIAVPTVMTARSGV